MGIIDELTKEREKKDYILDRLIIDLYKKCIKEIKFENKAGLTSMSFEVPMFLMGYPLYDQEEVTLLLNKMLKKKGFKTIFYEPCRIQISW
jgi:hypothetical protein